MEIGIPDRLPDRFNFTKKLREISSSLEPCLWRVTAEGGRPRNKETDNQRGYHEDNFQI